MAKDLTSTNNDFGAVISIIENAKGRALKAVNAELINMYWEVGEYLSKLCAESSFGDKVVDEVADYRNFDAVLMTDIPEKTPKKLKIIKANQYMVNESEFLICYVKNSWGGAAKTLEYAKQKKKNICNLA